MNFLFLSKLLPLFLYPLGLGVLLLGGALVLAKYQPQWIAPPIVLALVILWVFGTGWVSALLTRSLEWRYLPPNPIPEAQAIVVLGGATRSAAYPRPMVDVMESGDRLLYGAQLYRWGRAPWVILSGGRTPWRGGGEPEALDMQQLLALMGVPADATLLEPKSLNTYENAVKVRELLEPLGIQRILLVTSAMHMPRALALFQKQGFQVTPAPTDFLISEQEWSELTALPESVMLNLLPEARHLDESSRAIKEYLGLVVYRLKGWI